MTTECKRSRPHVEQIDPLTQRKMSDRCWNGRHRGATEYSNPCSGWMDIHLLADKKECERCQCACHDDCPPKPRKVKPVSLDLPDVGTIRV